MKKGICLVIVVVGLFLIWGTAGALELDHISTSQAVIRICVILPIMAGAVLGGGLYKWE